MLALPYSRLTTGPLSRSRLGISLAVVAVGVVGLASPVGASSAPRPAAVIGTPLPPGWELCVLQGVGASPTPDDVADLDEWQVVEGGSTNNAAAYNPFNTRQATDSTGSSLPVVASSGGFPAFATWAAGCAATVAALLQPSMAPIVSALKTGNVVVPGIFLDDVDHSPWCAPSSDGIPCYASEILAGELVQALVNGSSGQLQGALTSYSDTGVDLRSYEDDTSLTAADQGLLATRNAQLAVALRDVSVAQGVLAAATREFRQLAVDAYTDDTMVRADPTLQLLAPPDDEDIVTQYFRSIAGTLLTDRFDQAEAAVKASIEERQAAQASVAQATSLLGSAQAAQNQALSALEADVKTIEAGMACAAPPLITAASSSAGDLSSVGQLWAALQDCLAPPAPVTAPVTGSTPS